MQNTFTTLVGKLVRQASRLRGGSGSALPGLVVEKIDSGYMRRVLSQLPHGVVLVSGTNGKTTTTKMIVELLEGQGLTVFTNRTGSNFTRGVAAALLGDVTTGGTLRADIAVLELDEAHAVHFVKAVQPQYALLLNVMRDQLDRFGEIDYTAKLLQTIAEHTTEGVILNREDPRIRAIAATTGAKNVSYFGLDTALRPHFPADDDMRGGMAPASELPHTDVLLTSFEESNATFALDGATHFVPLAVRGAYNIFNAAAALATVRQVLGDECDTEKLLTSLSNVQPAFGRGERLTVGGQPLDLVLVKNPSGFRLGLSSFNPKTYATMIVINDNYADGRDMSWLWDVEFESLKENGVAMVSGIRAYDMTLRLEYDTVPVEKTEPSLPAALRAFIAAYPDQPKRIYCTYTAMLALRRELAKITDVKAID